MNKKKDKINSDSTKLINLSIGKTIDNEGVLDDNEFDRYQIKIGNNRNYFKLQIKTFTLEVIAIITLIISLISFGNAFLKDSPGHYIQKPNGLVEQINVYK